MDGHHPLDDADGPTMPIGEDWPEIRESVARICAPFDNAYWTNLDEANEYPDAFVQALTDAGIEAELGEHGQARHGASETLAVEPRPPAELVEEIDSQSPRFRE